MVLRAQVRLEPQRRTYSADEAAGLTDLFGSRERWGSTLRPFLWMQCSTVVQGFSGSTDVDLSLPCTYDFEVAASRYLHALRDGGVPVLLLFSGTVFTRGPAGFAVEQIPWDREVRGELPVHVWRDLMQQHFPGTGWLRLEHETLARLAAYKAERGHTSNDEALADLLSRAQERVG